MHCRRNIAFQPASMLIGLILLGLVEGCSRQGPSMPDSQVSLLGTWSGAVTSDVIGAGDATVVFESQIESNRLLLLTGSWMLAFPNHAFDANGTMAANVSVGDTIVGVFFSRATVPCPDEPEKQPQKAIAASLTLSGNRMHGPYIVGGCPGGTFDLVRR